jgi:hypothetical protein
MSYILRSKAGVMLFKCSNSIAQEMIEHNTGFFRPYQNSEMPKSVPVYQFSSAISFEVSGIKVFIWEDSILIPLDS